MNTISFDEPINISKNHFKTLEDFQLYIVQKLQKSELSDSHKEILDARILEANESPENYISLNELKSSIKKKIMYQLQIRSLAKEDILEIVDYYDTKASLLVTDRFLENLYFEFDFLQKNPNSFQIKYRRTRVRYLKNFPFGIHYRIKENVIIEILAILNTNRDPKVWKNR